MCTDGDQPKALSRQAGRHSSTELQLQSPQVLKKFNILVLTLKAVCSEEEFRKSKGDIKSLDLLSKASNT